MRKAQPVLAFALLVTLGCICSTSGGQTPVTPGVTQESKVGTINLVNSQVETGPVDNLQFLEGLQDFHNGDSVRVSGGGKSELNLDDGSQLLIFNDTQIDRVNVSVSPNETRLRLVEQGLDGYVPPGENFIADMPNLAVFTILGTRFFILYDSATQTATAGNYDGTVLFTPPGGTEQPLPPGAMVSIPAQGGVTLTELPFTPEEFEGAVDRWGTPTAALENLMQQYATGPTSTATELPVTVTEPPPITVLPPVVTGWSTWEDLGGSFNDSPAVASWGPNRLDIFVRGLDDSLWHKWLDGSGWGDWEGLGGIIRSGPGAVSWGVNRIDIFAVGQDSQIWQFVWDGQWNGWYPQGGVASEGEIPPVPEGSPAVASWAANRLGLYAFRSDLMLIHKSWDGAAWSDWENLGGPVYSSPSVVGLEANHTMMAIRGPEDHVFVLGMIQAGQDLGQSIQGSPAISFWEPDRFDVFARAKDDSLIHTFWTTASGWSDWENLGGPIYSSPAAVSWGPGRIDVFARGNAGQLLHIWYQE